MHNRKWSVVFLLVFCVLCWGFNKNKSIEYSEETAISVILHELGEPLPKHARPDADEATIKRGFELVHEGRTTGPNGKKSKYISKYFNCTSCHNQVQEDPILNTLNPESRLEYAIEKELKFLPASTFYGIANRESWYNDDYYKKYGELVKPANNSLAEATQLCAKVCSSGRYLEEWELEAILAYYWSIQVRVKDLDLNESEKAQFKNPTNKEESISMLKRKYALKSPATFGEHPSNFRVGYSNLEGNSERGKQLYKLSCMACHQAGGVSDITFDYSPLTFQKFLRQIDKSGNYNLYDIIRHGTYADKGKPRYMPLYPKERLSDQQVEDLRAYMKSAS